MNLGTKVIGTILLSAMLLLSACSNSNSKGNLPQSSPQISKNSELNVPDEPSSPQVADDNKTTNETMSEVLISTVEKYLERGSGSIPEDLREQTANAIEGGLEWIDEDNKVKFREIATYIREDDEEKVKELFSEIKQGNGDKKVSLPEKKPVDISLKGKGDNATDPFYLEAGFAIFDSSYKGDSNFIVHLLEEDGSKKSLINTIGTYDGKTLAIIDADGEYLLNVKADQPWKISVSQAIPTDIQSAPTKISSKNDDVVFIDLEAKLTKFSFTHKGDSNFIVKLNGGSSLVNEIGDYEGSTAKKVDSSGTYILSVRSEGTWTVDIK